MNEPKEKELKPDLKQLLEDNKTRCDLMIGLGLPGCLGMGYKPGTSPGKIQKSDPLTQKLVDTIFEMSMGIYFLHKEKETIQ